MPLTRGNDVQERPSSRILPQQGHRVSAVNPRDLTQEGHRNVFIEEDRGHAEFGGMQ